MMEFLSPAKINIGLNIISKRNDGYHNIETIFYPVKLSDKLFFKRSDSISIITNDPSLPTDQRNLIYKSIMILSEFVGKPLNVNVEVEKNIPVFAGLGGGSSNAAVTLIALNEIFNLDLSKVDLMKLAIKIGSDVPFFILNQAAFAQGRGEILTPLPELRMNYKILIVVPKIKISTAWAYSNFKKSTKKIDLSSIKTINDFEENKCKITNDFENIVFPSYPELEKIKTTLLENGAVFSLLSGSGSSIYGLFSSDFDLTELKKLFTNYQVFEC